MKSIRFERWCAAATDSIRFKPDRKEVREELYAHMEDQYEELVDAGVSESDAEAEVAASMGDPKETAAQLEKVYRPFWGYALRVARWCLLVSVILALFTLPGYIRGIRLNPAKNQSFSPETVETEEWVDRRVYYAEPRSRVRSDGYTFTLTRVTERHIEGKTVEFSRDDFYLTVEVFNPRPWALNSDVLREFYAVDSLGNVYCASNRAPDHQTPALVGNPSRTGFLTYTWELWLREYRSQEADWIELRYDHSGRDLRLTIDLRDRKGAAG